MNNPPASARGAGDTRLIPGSGRSPGGGPGNPLQYSCPENHGQMSLEGHSPQLGMTEWSAWTQMLTKDMVAIILQYLSGSIQHIGGGNGNPLQYSCLEKSHGRRSLVGCSPWARKESDIIERLPFHFSLSCIGEGNGNPLQCSCLENPRDSRAWWAAVYGVAQSQPRLKQLSSSSSSIQHIVHLITSWS